MAKYAPVVPLMAAERMNRWGILGNYHLLLAHDILRLPTQYQQVYGHLKDDRLAFVILDNSVVELGKAMDPEDLIRAAEFIQPNVVVAPDTMGDHIDTINKVDAFSKDWSRLAHNLPRTGIMAVLQGQTYAQVHECFIAIADMPWITTIGVPRVVTKYLGTRSEIVRMATAGRMMGRIHLLGFSDDIMDDIACARMPGVRGIDSAVPIRLACRQLVMSLDFPQDPGPRGQFWETDDTTIDFCRSYITKNVEQFRRWIRVKRNDRPAGS